jgi:hypothetical protein
LARRTCGFQRDLRAKSHHHVGLRADQFSRGSEGLGRSLVRPSEFDQSIALGETELLQFSKERRVTRSKKWAVGIESKEPDTRDLSVLLRAR